jgi:hypothetical protein
MFGLSGVAAAQPSGGTDHFKCYEAAEQTFDVAIDISVNDQFFGAEEFLASQAGDAVMFCNPVLEKTIAGVTEDTSDEEELHLTLYPLAEKRATVRKRIEITNQLNNFAPQRLSVVGPKFIAVPTIKNNDTPSGGDDLSHFTCYEASGKRVNVSATLDDQFHSEAVLIHAPALFCNPATKRRAGFDDVEPETDEEHLACYKITPSEAPPANFSTVEIDNQFDQNETLRIGPSKLVCLPSTKRVL